MSPENVHDRKDNRHLTVVFVPGGESSKTRTISVSKWGFYLSIAGIFVVVVAGIFSLIVYTPLRSLLPVSNTELEKRYGGQIYQIQQEVTQLVEEMNVLRSYNLRLRKALGESMSTEDSTLAASYEPPQGMGQQTSSSQRSSGEPMAGSAGGREPNSTNDLNTGISLQGSGVMSRPESPVREGRKATIEFPLAKPAEGYLTQKFDVARYHYGIDLAGKRSTAVVAAADGNVVFSGWTYDDGYMLMIAHVGGYLTVYKHNESLLKNTGAIVRRGEPVALLGNTGRTSSGPHLHFELWKNGIAYDPGQFLLITQ